MYRKSYHEWYRTRQKEITTKVTTQAELDAFIEKYRDEWERKNVSFFVNSKLNTFKI